MVNERFTGRPCKQMPYRKEGKAYKASVLLLLKPNFAIFAAALFTGKYIGRQAFTIFATH